MQGPQGKSVLWYNADFAGCGYIRSVFPNDMLNMKYGARKLYEGFLSSRFLVDNNILAQLRGVHFQRQITQGQLQYMNWLKEMKKKNNWGYVLYYDLDDNFANIPEYNFAYQYYSNLPINDLMKQVCNIIEIFTVSTDEMAKWIASYGGTCQIKVIPNLVPRHIFRPYDWEKKRNAKPRVVWAGSPTHFSDNDMGDVRLIADLMRNTIDEFDWVILGMRHVPPWFKDMQGKFKTITWYNTFEFPTKLKELNCDFGVAPLIRNTFNDCKSNIKLLDYYSSDIVGIASHCPAYDDTSLLFLDDDWKKTRDDIRMIWETEGLQQKFINDQLEIMKKYWMEDHTDIYFKDLFGLTEPRRA